jgi:segregation and condensation protein A
MEVVKIIDNLKDLLIKYTTNSESLLKEDLNLIFNKIENIDFKEDIDNYAEFVLLGASLFEIKAKSLLPQEEELDWLDEIELMKDKDLAFARLLQFKAFSEVGIALASRIKNNEISIPAFKHYQTKDLLIKPEIKYEININEFENIAKEVFTRYKTFKGFQHIDKDLPDIQQSIDELLDVVDKRLTTSFEELVLGVKTTEQAVAFFLALLETVKWGFIKADQDNIDREINIEKNYE